LAHRARLRFLERIARLCANADYQDFVPALASVDYLRAFFRERLALMWITLAIPNDAADGVPTRPLEYGVFVDASNAFTLSC
jgi:hypothetical protein